MVSFATGSAATGPPAEPLLSPPLSARPRVLLCATAAGGGCGALLPITSCYCCLLPGLPPLPIRATGSALVLPHPLASPPSPFPTHPLHHPPLCPPRRHPLLLLPLLPPPCAANPSSQPAPLLSTHPPTRPSTRSRPLPTYPLHPYPYPPGTTYPVVCVAGLQLVHPS
jgi:hypothetical protein